MVGNDTILFTKRETGVSGLVSKVNEAIENSRITTTETYDLLGGSRLVEAKDM